MILSNRIRSKFFARGVGSELPKSVQVLSTRLIEGKFRTEGDTIKGECVCRLSLTRGPSMFAEQCACRFPRELSLSTVEGTTRLLVNACRFTKCASGGSRGSAGEAVCTVVVYKRKDGIDVRCRKAKFLCRVMEVLAKALLRIKAKTQDVRDIGRPLGSGSEDRTKFLTPTENLFLSRICC